MTETPSPESHEVTRGKETANLVKEYAIFDVDGLIVNTEKVYFLAQEQLAKEKGKQWTEDMQEQLLGAGGGAMGKYAELLELDIPTDTEQKKEFLKNLEEQRDQHFVKILNNDEGKLVMNGFFELIQMLKQNGVKLAISTTSSRKNLDIIFGLLNRAKPEIIDNLIQGQNSESPEIQDLFEIILARDDDTKVFNSYTEHDSDKQYINQEVLKRLGIRPDQAMMFEDSTGGCHAAKNAGIGLVIGIPNENTKRRALASGEDFRFQGADVLMNDLGYAKTILEKAYQQNTQP